MRPIDLLEELIKISSSTNEPAGINQLGKYIAKLFPKTDFTIEFLSKAGFPNALYIKSKRFEKHAKKILVSGHLDTVFSLKDCPCHLTKDFICGSGSNDMKGGLAVAIITLLKLNENLGRTSNIGFILTPDEESGSKIYRSEMEKISEDYDYCLVLEGMGDGGELCDSRRGISTFSAHFYGKAGHSGHFTTIYPNAIQLMSEFVCESTHLQDFRHGLTINMGKVSGGVAMNVVAGECHIEGEIRYSSKLQLKKVKEYFDNFCQSKKDNDKKIEIFYNDIFPVMELSDKTTQLKTMIESAFFQAGIDKPIFHHRKSGSDGNLFAEMGLGVIDGFGTMGEGIHTLQEKTLISSLEIATKRLEALLSYHQNTLQR